MTSIPSSRELAFSALKFVYQKGAYTDIALDRVLKTAQNSPEISAEISQKERSFACELVYGVVRRQRTLDVLIDLLGKRSAAQQPPELRIILQLGLYQLRYLSKVPAAAAVNTSVELAKKQNLGQLSGVVNGVLRSYLRQAEESDPLVLPLENVSRLGTQYSFPDWIVENWLEQLAQDTTEVAQLLDWFNQPPKLDLRVNPLQSSVERVARTLQEAGIIVETLPHLPQGLRLQGAGEIAKLPGYQEGWWVVQDSSAQLVTHLLNPQPGETIIDACAAPGGKTTHIAELLQDQGQVIACDRSGKRLRKVIQNATRLKLNSISIEETNSCHHPQFRATADRVLLDAPCSGLGTLHKRPDIRWRPATNRELFELQQELLTQTATWVKSRGVLVYATCTLNVWENENIIKSFLAKNSHWSIQSPPETIPSNWVTKEGWIKVYPHRYDMDGFFMVGLVRD